MSDRALNVALLAGLEALVDSLDDDGYLALTAWSERTNGVGVTAHIDELARGLRRGELGRDELRDLGRAINRFLQPPARLAAR